MEKKIKASGHFSRVLSSELLKEIVVESVQQLSTLDFDTLAFTGLSGAIVAPIIANQMGKELLMVRKNGGQDGSYSSQWIEGHVGAKRVVIVDDLISSGKTMSQMMRALRYTQHNNSKDLKVVGLLLHMWYCIKKNDYKAQLFSLEPGSKRRIQLEGLLNSSHCEKLSLYEQYDYSADPSLFEGTTEVPLTEFNVVL